MGKVVDNVFCSLNNKIDGILLKEQTMVKPILLCTISIGSIFCQTAVAKRGAAPQVEPLFYKGIKFIATCDRMGYVEAWDVETNKKVWEKKVYSVLINPFKEADVQWIFIESLAIEGDTLIVITERSKRYRVKIPKEILK